MRVSAGVETLGIRAILAGGFPLKRRFVKPASMTNIPATETPGAEAEIRRKRIRVRAWRRGMREMDILMGGFVNARIDTLDDQEIAELEILLDQPDAEVFGWISGVASPPPERDTALLRKIVAFHTHERPIN